MLGSFLWGWLGDRVGRRASILYAGIGFVGTSVCGAMPSFAWNLVMCFLMGITVGGMLPLCYALLAEAMPARHRSWLMILVGADIAGAYVLTSWLASVLVPTYSWRILWLIGLPTGLVLILLNRWIPESPRFLLAHGRVDEARAVMQRYGAAVIEAPASRAAVDAAPSGRWTELGAPRFLGLTLVIACLGIGSGLVLFGFNLWIPSNLRTLGYTEADAILRNAALMGLPLSIVVAWMYGVWSSRKTIIVISSLTAAAVYSAEIYPTRIRSRGAGFATGASKAGGVAIIGLVTFGVATPGIVTVALIGAVPMALAVVLMFAFGIETRQRPLEDIAAEALDGELQASVSAA